MKVNKTKKERKKERKKDRKKYIVRNKKEERKKTMVNVYECYCAPFLT